MGGSRFLAALLLLGAVPARGVIIASGDGTGNTSAPPDDPGWAHVGVPVGLTAVYLRNNWVLTADHVPAAATTFAGVTYPWIPGSERRFRLVGGTCPPAPAPCSDLSDLEVYKIQGDVPLAPLAIRAAEPVVGSELVMIGNGLDRGAPAAGCTPFRQGWSWGPATSLRWGTNRVDLTGLDLPVGTRISRYFVTDLTELEQPGATLHEAQAANGDSGGAVFIAEGPAWELAGILSAVSSCTGLALFGDQTLGVDLSYYAADIAAVVEVPPCADGFDDDADGRIDADDPGCQDAGDLSERDPLLPCDDGTDNDGDGSRDFPADIGCHSPRWTTENPACDDGLDNDGDGGIDHDGGPGGGAADPQCAGQPWRRREQPGPGCGLGFELALLPLLPLLRRAKGAARAA